MDKFNMIFVILFSLVTDTLSGNNCTVTTNMFHVKFTCAARGFHFVPENLPLTMTKLDLSRNKITVLTNSSFKLYTNMISLIIDNNLVRYLEADAFTGLVRLQFLSMRQNKLDLTKAYHPNVFKSLYSLKNLDITNNMDESPAKTMSVNYPYFGDLLHLTWIGMDLVQDPSFNASGLEKLTRLRIMKFEKCYLVKMLNKTFLDLLHSIQEVYFRRCESFISVVEVNFLRPFPALQVLSLYHMNLHLSKALQLLYPFNNKHLKAVVYMRVSTANHQSVIINCKMMSYLQNICVQTLVLAESEIVDFEPGSLLTYKYPKCFENIVLSGNRFSLGGENIGDLLRLSAEVTNLKTFDFSYNPLKYSKIQYLSMRNMHVNDDYLENPKSKEACLNSSPDFRTDQPDTEYNWKFTLREKAISGKTEITITLPHKLKTLRMTHFLSTIVDGKQKITMRNASNLQYLDMSYFQMAYFPDIEFVGALNIKYLDFSGIDSTLYSGRSSIPLFQHLKTATLKDARLDQTMRTNGNIFRLIPKVETLDISWNNLWYMDKNAFSENKYLKHLTISNNLLSEIPLEITSLSTLNYLDITYNRLHTINGTIRKWIDGQNKKSKSKFKLYLWGNVFKCTCATADFIQWLFSTGVDLDKNRKTYKCKLSNGTETDTLKVYNHFHEHFSNCNSELWLRVGIGCLTAFVVLTIPTAVIFNFRWKIAYWAYRKFKRVIKSGMERKFKYDIYVSYAEDNILWIRDTLVPKIENSWNMKMCLEHRDFLVGDETADTIANAIQESRHVIFVISESFKDSKWRTFEIERTKFEKYTNDLQKIIVIAKTVYVNNVPYEFDKIQKDVTTIEWSGDNEILWDKLRMTLFSDSI